ncbi:MAG TPA: carboxypeptidase-like regulatory domain-containing protein [Candidatus Acidoferrales bacterium]|nr:carboxypeptidase-like regulatory domain-containing protein [Candidatus Acidoferrales bacterium]
MRFLILSSPLGTPWCKALPFKLLALFLFLACPFASVSFAQTPGGSIIGTVTEKHAGPLAGARVLVSNVQTGFTANVSTDVNGQFTAENLPAGAYKVSVSGNGLVTQEVKVAVKIGHKSKMSVTLKPPPPPVVPLPPK